MSFYSVNSKKLTDSVKVRLIGEKAFFGPGPRKLLSYIQECGSVSAACEKMGISYSKGRTLIRNMERELGITLVERTHGGYGGGSARVTDAGHDLMERYSAYEKDVSEYADKVFLNYFQDMGEKK